VEDTISKLKYYSKSVHILGSHYMRYISQCRFSLHAVYITMHGSHYIRYITKWMVLIKCGIYHNARFSLYAVYNTMHGPY